MNLKHYSPIVATPFVVVALLALLLPSTPDAPIPMKANEDSATVGFARAATVTEASSLPSRRVLVDKTPNARRGTQSTRKVRDAADASPRGSIEPWCAGVYDPARGSNFAACR